jgi:hypothetical protein
MTAILDITKFIIIIKKDMRKYVSLGSAMLMGTVLGRKQTPHEEIMTR